MMEPQFVTPNHSYSFVTGASHVRLRLGGRGRGAGTMLPDAGAGDLVRMERQDVANVKRLDLPE
jgi:hypothetical protein